MHKAGVSNAQLVRVQGTHARIPSMTTEHLPPSAGSERARALVQRSRDKEEKKLWDSRYVPPGNAWFHAGDPNGGYDPVTLAERMFCDHVIAFINRVEHAVGTHLLVMRTVVLKTAPHRLAAMETITEYVRKHKPSMRIAKNASDLFQSRFKQSPGTPNTRYAMDMVDDVEDTTQLRVFVYGPLIDAEARLRKVCEDAALKDNANGIIARLSTIDAADLACAHSAKIMGAALETGTRSRAIPVFIYTIDSPTPSCGCYWVPTALPEELTGEKPRLGAERPRTVRFADEVGQSIDLMCSEKDDE